MLINLKSLSLVLVMISSMSVPICNRFHATRDNCGKITTYKMWVTTLTPACAGLLEPRGSGLGLLKFTFNAENFICRLSCLSPAISSQFSVEMCVASKNCKKFTKTFFGRFKVIQGH